MSHFLEPLGRQFLGMYHLSNVLWKAKASFRASNLPCITVDEEAGPKTKIMRKAKMSFQSGQVKQVIRAYAVEIQTDSKKDLELDTVTLKLRKAMGANCKSHHLSS